MSENTSIEGAEEGPGVRMTSLQYEALCRHAISRLYGVPVGEIHSGHLLGVSNRRQKVRHQIDLYWDVSDGVLEYRVFANAKWRMDTLQVEDMMALIGVWRDIGAHKAVLITNTGFDIGVKKQAEEKGIGLLIVKPVGDFGEMGTRNVGMLVEHVERIAEGRGEAVFAAEVVHKGFGGMENGKWRMENERVARPLDARAGDQESSGTIDGAEGGIWLIGGSGDGEESIGVEDKALGEIPNKMMEGR